MGRKPNTAGIKVIPNEIDYESMIFYITWYKQLLKLEETYGPSIFERGVKELCEYSFHGKIPDNSDNPVLEMFFDMARASIDANIKLRIAGKMGSDIRWGKRDKAEEKPKETKGRRKRTPKKKEPEIIQEENPEDEGWLDPTPENIALMKAQEIGADGSS